MNPQQQFRMPIIYRYAMMCLLLLATFSKAHAQSIVAAGYNFTASSKTYTYLTGSATPITNLFNSSTGNIDFDDGYVTIPLGFNFTFCGVDYSDVTVCANGWLRFGTGTGTASPYWNYNWDQYSGIEPAVYALYEDISGLYGTTAYEITGSTGNHVFTWECRDWCWDFNSTSPVVSFQVKLYEATGQIECLYHQEPGTVQLNFSGGATIGIGTNSSDWQTLEDVSSSPVSSNTNWTSWLDEVPATGQSYMWDPGPPCGSPAPVNISGYNSKSVSFDWTAASGVMGYEYAVDEVNSPTPGPTATKIFTTNNSAMVNGLKPSTLYYVHVRSKCGTYNFSKWEMKSIETRPACSDPGKIIITHIDSNSVKFQWPSVPTALTYEYIVDDDPTTPATNAGAISQSSIFVDMKSLTEGTMYYVHYRSLCDGADSSAWSLDSFYIPTPCRRAVPELTDLRSNDAVITWSPVKTAYTYEYYISQSDFPPAFGTPVNANMVQTPYLISATEYNFFVRCKCDDRGVRTMSDWTDLKFTTPFPLGVNTQAISMVSVYAYPNPVTDELFVTVSGNRAANAQLMITDVSGKILRTQNVEQNTTNVNIKGLPPGVLVLHYKDDNTSKVQKIVKQ